MGLKVPYAKHQIQEIVTLSLTKDEAKTLLQRQIDIIKQLKMKSHYPPEFEPWRKQTLRIIERVFGPKSDHAKQLDSISFGLSFFTNGTLDSEWEKAYQEGLVNAEFTLKSFIDELDLFDKTNTMVCPKCGRNNAAFLEISQIGSKKYSVAVPQVAGAEWHSGKKAAFFMCNNCQAVFYTEAFKQK